jgi:hypothetical protein
MKKQLLLAFAMATSLALNAQVKAKPEDTEYYTPVPKKVTPAKGITAAPSDAIVLFNGTNLDEWELVNNPNSKETWDLVDGAMRVSKTNGDIQTKRKFMNFQLHIEYNIPSYITGSGQARGNSGIFLASLPKEIGNAGGYELQVLDNFTNTTYVNGQVGSIYKQNPPLVNAALPAGEWQTYDVIFIAPRFNKNGQILSQARITVIHNGVLVQNNASIWGGTEYIGIANYGQHGAKGPISLQDHGDLVSYRNIWIREIE